ncbi:uncharacterized protein LOC127103458 [Lathyrus oleraceus]|uniref:uncharacterized protein LOC127103458 n=1 Tax=Pisum sativum TaxID=3888 RepID=UPI0021CEDC39|nr:uncharacterized protein LOC127103458 [Pisum sativum]
MTTLFHDMVHEEIEVYVADMISKFKTEEERVEYLLKLFQRLRKYELRMNPNKSTFRVRSGKLLGFIVNQQGIEGLIFDGVVNAYGNGIGAVIVTPHGSHIPFTVRFTFTCTNNMEEYEACIMGLEEAIDLRIKIMNVYRDSVLVINQIKGEWETRQPGLIPYKDYVRRLSTFFNQIEFHHIPRE